MTEAAYKAPAVHTAIAAILASLSVQKDGQLPSNMSGKDYMTATAINDEVKRLFVANDLIFLPQEDLVVKEAMINKDRLQVLLTIKGTYTIISTKDGSQVTISGVGDGLASASAVAASIASTFALKNALQRLFLITEQSAEDAGKTGTREDQGPTRAQQRIESATEGNKPVSAGVARNQTIAQLQGQIREIGKTKGIDYLSVGNKFLNLSQPQWVNDPEKLQQVLNHITDL